MTKGKEVDIAGQKFGCLTALRRAQSHVAAGGSKVSQWLVRCECGREKPIRTGALRSRNHFSCGVGCTKREDAPVDVQCGSCGVAYTIRRASLRNGVVRRCRRCHAYAASLAGAAQPAKNRLPGDQGGFNILLSSYRKNAKDRGIAFGLTADEFRSITKRDCFYCGAQPAQLKVTKRGFAPAYVYNGIDRQDSSRGYVLGNVVACCAACNYMKGDLSLDEFYRRAAVIADRHRRRLAVEGLTLEIVR